VTSLAELLLIFVPMLVEARRAAANERAQLARGGVEPPGDVYAAMRVAYPTLFLAMILEGVLRGGPSRPWFAAGLVCFAAAKALKWWAILTLGRFWTFRVIVVPGTTLVARGPYRLMKHPNYFGVAGELAGVGLMTGALISAPISVAAFGWLIVMRIKVEEAALANGAGSRV